jgi:hypothetical protein
MPIQVVRASVQFKIIGSQKIALIRFFGRMEESSEDPLAQVQGTLNAWQLEKVRGLFVFSFVFFFTFSLVFIIAPFRR